MKTVVWYRFWMCWMAIESLVRQHEIIALLIYWPLVGSKNQLLTKHWHIITFYVTQQTVAYLHIQQIWNICIQLELRSKSKNDVQFSSSLFFHPHAGMISLLQDAKCFNMFTSWLLTLYATLNETAAHCKWSRHYNSSDSRWKCWPSHKHPALKRSCLLFFLSFKLVLCHVGSQICSFQFCWLIVLTQTVSLFL